MGNEVILIRLKGSENQRLRKIPINRISNFVRIYCKIIYMLPLNL